MEEDDECSNDLLENDTVSVEEDEQYRYDEGCDWNYDQPEFDQEIDDIQEEGGKKNIESFDYRCLDYEASKSILDGIINDLTTNTQLSHSLAKILLIHSKWDVSEVINKYFICDNNFFESKGVKPVHRSFVDVLEACQTNSFCLPHHLFNRKNVSQIFTDVATKMICEVCFENKPTKDFISLLCGHLYCRDCWFYHLSVNIENGQSVNIGCMRPDCQLFCPEDFVNFMLKTEDTLIEKYNMRYFRQSVESYKLMRHCVESNCQTVISCQEQPAPKRVVCSNCNRSFCFQCGNDYHAPTDCKTIILWYRKCVDDSETAHYITANTKLCPSCGTCIEKNGGCNHMSCYSCKYEFCWICQGPWIDHRSFYHCSKYKENSEVKSESDRAREALKKYLFYFERWDNHMKSLRLEDKNLQNIREKIDEELKKNNGTWIDWQYLLRGAQILSKCRYTLQYTYPYAYYMESGPQKELFEYQQAALENEIENLAWKIENAETNDRGGLENQMTIVEKRRTTLLYNFFQY